MYIKLLLLITLIDILFVNRFIINIFLVEVVGKYIYNNISVTKILIIIVFHLVYRFVLYFIIIIVYS